MMHLVLAAAAPLFVGAAPANAVATFEAPPSYIVGLDFPVTLEIAAPEGGAELPAWFLQGGAFAADGKPLGDRKAKGTVPLAPGIRLTVELDLGPALQAAKIQGGDGFALTLAKEFHSDKELRVTTKEKAPEGLNFMEMPVEELSNYHVLLRTNRGDMEAEFWPDVAPNHVRNFLDLSYTGFYDGVIFHRVIPGFMIQGGDPTGTGTGSGPRRLKAEFSDKKHVAGVLSMARSQSPDSASSQFFVMHDTSPHLDGSYSAFGQLVSGQEVVDKIVTSPTAGADRPREEQVIQQAIVLKAGG